MKNSVCPTAQVEPFVTVLGEELAIKFLLKFGGAELYFSANPRSTSELARLVGREKAGALAVVSERLPSRIPTAKPWIAKVLAARGQSKASIARTLHVSDVTVRKWLKGREFRQPPRENPQLRLL